MPYSFAPSAQTHVPVLACLGHQDIDYEQSQLLKDNRQILLMQFFDTLLWVFWS